MAVSKPDLIISDPVKMKPPYFALLVVQLLLFDLNCASFAQQRFPCLPPTLKPTDIVSAERVGDPPEILKVTVEEKLIQLKARCMNGQLLVAAGREIRFYRIHCFGAPTAYAIETMRREQDELEALRKKYTVIEMTCDPSGKPRP